MLFTVIGPDGSIKASTDYIQCIYNNDTLVSMDRCGYKFELYGKRIRIRMLLDELAKLRSLPQPLQSKPYSEVNAAAETTIDTVSENSSECCDESTPVAVDDKHAEYPSVEETQPLKSAEIKPEKKLTRILCVDTGKIYNKQSEAAKDLGIDPAAVSDSLKSGKRRAGYIFERVE